MVLANQAKFLRGDLDPSTGREGWWGANLLDAVRNGTLPQERLDDMVTRIMSAYYFVGQDRGYPEVSIASNLATLDDPLNPLATYYNGTKVNFHIEYALQLQ